MNFPRRVGILAHWRKFLWAQLLEPQLHPKWQDLLVKVSLDRAAVGSVWVTVDDLDIATQLVDRGVLRSQDRSGNLFRPEHDLIEDWALLLHVERKFCEHQNNPEQLFTHLGSRLLVRRAFRQFFGERLESDGSEQALSFLCDVFTDPSTSKDWKQEITIALLGSARALNALRQTANLWTDTEGGGLRILCHVLRIAYLTKAEEAAPERPFGPGWDALMTFIVDQGNAFLGQHTAQITALLLDWHHAVTPESPNPNGLAAAAQLVQELWLIATESDKRFEDYWGEEHRHYPSEQNRLLWLVAAVASGLQPSFFVNATRIAVQDRQTFHSDNLQQARQCRELLESLSQIIAAGLSREHIREPWCVYACNRTA